MLKPIITMSQTPNQKNKTENSHIEVTGNFHQGDVTYINKYFAEDHPRTTELKKTFRYDCLNIL